MEKPQVQSIDQARDWFSNTENNKDGIGVICLRPDGHTGRMGNVEEAEKWFGESGTALTEEEMETKFPTPPPVVEQPTGEEGVAAGNGE